MALRNKIHCIQHITKAFPSGLLTLDWPSYSCVTAWRNKFLWNAGCISESICLKKNIHLVGNDFWILLRGGNALRNNGVLYIYICFLWWPLFQNSSFALNTRVKSLHIHDFSGSTHTALVKHQNNSLVIFMKQNTLPWLQPQKDQSSPTLTCERYRKCKSWLCWNSTCIVVNVIRYWVQLVSVLMWYYNLTHVNWLSLELNIPSTQLMFTLVFNTFFYISITLYK